MRPMMFERLRRSSRFAAAPDKADYHKTADKLHRPRADEQKQDSVYEESDYEYVQEVLPAQVEESQRRTPLASIFQLL